MPDLKDISFPRLARETGTNASYIWMIFNRQRTPSRFVAKELERATGVMAPAWIFPEQYSNPLIEQYLANKQK